MADRLAGAKELLKNAKFWKVVGGASSGGLIVKESSKLSSSELKERLSTGALVQQTELVGDRLKYKLVNGSGPASGWVSTKFKGNELLVKHTLRIAIMGAGSRGDLQPLLSLGLGLKRSGFRVSLWTHADFCESVESAGLPCFDLFDTIHDHKDKEESEDKKLERERNSESFSFWTRFNLSMCYDTKVCGVSWKEPVPELTGVFESREACVSMLANAAVMAVSLGKAQVADQIGKAAEEMIMSSAEGTSQGPGNSAEMEKATANNTADTKAEAATSAAPSGPEGQQIEEAPEDRWKEDIERYKKGDFGPAWIGLIGISRFCTDSDPTRPQRFLEAYEKEEPDLILWHFGQLHALALNLEMKYGTPGIPLGLYSMVDLADPTAPWMSPEVWYNLVLQNIPELRELGTLEEARAKWPPPEEKLMDPPFYLTIMKVEEALLEPIFGCSAARNMGAELFYKRLNEGFLVCYLTSLTSKRFVSWMGEQSRRTIAKHTFTGFWSMDEEDQTSGSADMFGGPEVLKQVEDFLAAGPKPAYIGWGSMVSTKGAQWMCALAVAALKEAGMRGIVLGGWADLSMDVLQETLGGSDELGLCAYAEKNVLFVAKSPQVWLFPKCAALVIHGGSGTMGAAWASGVPTVVTPVMVDQPNNGLLNVCIGAGLCTRNLNDISPFELANALKQAAASPDLIRGAQAVQLSIMRDRPIEKATARILEFLTEDIPSGKWRSIRAEMEHRDRMVNELFSKFDEDGDGYLNWQESQKLWWTVTSQPISDGSLLHAFLRAVPPGTEVTADYVEKGWTREHLLRWYRDVRIPHFTWGSMCGLYEDHQRCCP